MKSLLILLLLIVAGGGAYLSKPSEQSFKDMIQKKMEGQKDDAVGYITHFGKGRSERFLESCTYHDRFLWATIEHNGKTVYTGAFSTWFGGNLKIEKAN